MFLLSRYELNDLRIKADSPGDDVVIPRELLRRVLDELQDLEDDNEQMTAELDAIYRTDGNDEGGLRS